MNFFFETFLIPVASGMESRESQPSVAFSVLYKPSTDDQVAIVLAVASDRNHVREALSNKLGTTLFCYLS